ncbi:hypothetical protein SK128_028024, partial [Halocaridina rubra]
MASFVRCGTTTEGKSEVQRILLANTIHVMFLDLSCDFRRHSYRTDPCRSTLVSGILESRLTVTVNNSCPISIVPEIFEAHHWYHVCISVSNSVLILYQDGKTWPKKLENITSCTQKLEMGNMLSVCLGRNNSGFTFTGMIADLQIFPRQLESTDIKNHSTCQAGLADFIKFSDLELKSAIMTQKERTHLCEEPPSEFVALFDEMASQMDSYKFCRRLGGRLINNKDDMSSVAKQISGNKDVTFNAIWAWTGELLDENRGLVLSVDRDGESHTMEYTVSACFNTIACLIPFGKVGYWKERETLIFQAFPYKGHFIYQMHMGGFISKDVCKCDGGAKEETCLTAKFEGEVKLFSILGTSRMPLGRRIWYETEGLEIKNITLSQCVDDEFTCNNGDCIDLDSKCDGQPHCSDESDEGVICRCLPQHIPLYWQNICPSPNPYVYVHVQLNGIYSVSLETNSYSVCLTITMSWTDPRLTFNNLSNQTFIVSPETVENLWMPTMLFLNAMYEDNLRIQSNTGILVSYGVKAKHSGINTIKEGIE